MILQQHQRAWSNPEYAVLNWGCRRGKPWQQFEHDWAMAMRLGRKKRGSEY
jgi:hypothetical protein